MTVAPRTNMRVLFPSREKRVPGDVFTYQMPDGLFRFGRLIKRGVPVVGDAHPVQHLVYFYVGQSESKQPQRVLAPTDLLIPPLVVNQKPWTLGYFERIFRAPLLPGDVLAAHCFRDFKGRYFSDAGEELKAATGPCGEWGLHSYLTVDDALSVALGFPPVPDDGVTFTSRT